MTGFRACSLATYGSDAAARERRSKYSSVFYEKGDAPYMLLNCTVCVSPTAVPTRAARATIAAVSENCMAVVEESS